MAVSTSFLRNLGKSVAYSSMDVLGSLTPNTTDLIRATRSGVEDARNYMRINTSKIRTSMQTMERGAATRRARKYLDDVMTDIKNGNLSLGDTMDDIDAELNALTDSIVMAEPGSEGEINPEEAAPVNDIQQAQLKMTAASTQFQIDAMRQMQESFGKTSVNIAEYQTNRFTTAIFSQMAHQTEHFKVMESQLDAINKNLVEMMQYTQNIQGNVNRAQMAFYDQMTSFINAYDKRQKAARTGYTHKTNAADGFLGDSIFNVEQYKEIIRDNYNKSMVSMVGDLLNPGMLSTMLSGPRGKFQPQQLLLNGLLKAMVPKLARRSLARGDSQINIVAKTMLTRLGSYQYDMANHPLLGMLGSIFGIDPKVSRTLKLGNFKHGERTWNGEAQKALVSVIPKELAEIKAAILGQQAEYYDMRTGRYTTQDDIRERARIDFQSSMESAFANIFNKRGMLNPDEERDKKIWQSFSEETQKSIETIINEAVNNDSGLTRDMSKELRDILLENSRDVGGTEVDMRRMLGELASAVNTSRANIASYIKNLQESDNSFMQIAGSLRTPDGESLVDRNGNISYSALQQFLGANPIDLRASNAGRYAQTGQRYDVLSEEERQRIANQEGIIDRFNAQIRQWENSPNAVFRTAARAARRVVQGGNGRYATGMANRIDRAYGRVFDYGMFGDRGSRDRTTEEGEGEDPDAIPTPDEYAGPVDRIRQRVPSSPGSQTQRRRFGPRTGVTNNAFSEATEDSSTPESRTADAVEELRDTTNTAFGENGYMSRMFNSPMLKKFLQWFSKTKVGQSAIGGVKRAGTWVKNLFTRDYVDEETGERTSSVSSNLKGMLGQYKDFLASKLGFGRDSETSPEENTPVRAVERLTNSIDQTTEALTGDQEETPQRRAGSLMKTIGDFVHKRAPKALTGGILGGAAIGAAAGKLGLLGSLFLPAAPIGGAIVGSSLALLSSTETFKNVMFGKADDNGERDGGLISKKLRDGFKKALPVVGLGATGGVALKLITGLLGSIGGGSTTASLVGVLPSMFTPGGIFGAALIGGATGFALKNEKMQEILFGKNDPDGKKTGGMLSGLYNKFTSKIRPDGKNKAFSLSERVKKLGKSMLGGAVANVAFNQMGILGGALSFGGPIGGAIAGAALSIASSSDKFNEYLYGSQGEGGKRKKDGLFSRLGAALELNILEPGKNWLKNTALDFGWWLRENAEIPLRIIAAPVQRATESMADTVKGVIEKIGDKTKGVIERLLLPIGGTFNKLVLQPMGKLAGTFFKGGLFGMASIASIPLQGLSHLIAGKKYRAADRDLGDYMAENRDELLQRRYDALAAKNGGRLSRLDKLRTDVSYRMATMGPLGKFFRTSELMYGEGGVEDAYANDENNDITNRTVVGAMRDKLIYHSKRDDIRKSAREEEKIRQLRTKLARKDKYNQELILENPVKSAERITKLNEKLRKMDTGIEISDAEELQKFIYDYDGWKKARNAKLNPTETNTAETGEEEVGPKTEAWRDRVTTLIESIVGKLSESVDVQRGALDIAGGEQFDTSDIQDVDTRNALEGNHPNTISNKIDDNLVSNIQNENANRQAGAIFDALRQNDAAEENQMRLANIRGNTSGNAYDEDGNPIPVPVPEVQEEEEKKESFWSGLFSGTLGSVLKVIAPAGLAVLAATLLKNDDIRNFLSDAAKNVLGGLWDGAKNAVPDALGVDGGVNNTRALEVDEEGNATKSVTNNALVRHLGEAALHPVRTLQGFSKIRHPLRTIASGTGKAIDFADNLVRRAGGLASNADDVAGAAARTATAASKVADASAKSNNKLLSKALNLLSDALEVASKGKLGKLAGKLSAIMKKVGEFFTTIRNKVANKLFGKLAEKLCAAMAKFGVHWSAAAASVGILIAVEAAGGAVLGWCSADVLFNVNKDDLDWKMKLISSIFEAVSAATGVGALIAVISDIVAEFLGKNFLQWLAVLFYNAISDEEDESKLQSAISNMEKEVENYNKANGTNLSVEAYVDAKHSANSFTNKFKSLFGAGDKTDYTQYEVDEPETVEKKQPTTTTTTSRVDRRFGKTFATGYGSLQNDPRWANMPIGRLPNGQVSTMGMGGCGPTALANAAGALGMGVNPADIARYATESGYISQGGANDGLFDQGANEMGLNSTRVKGTQGIRDSLKQGKPVIVAGKDGSGQTPYSRAGHIVTLTGMDANGNAIVEDPERGTYPFSMDKLQSKMTAGWSLSGKKRESGSTEPTSSKAQGYGLFDDIFGGVVNSIIGGVYNHFGISQSEDGATSYDSSGNPILNPTESWTSSNTTYTKIDPTESSKQIYEYLIKHGFTKIGASGIMGCWGAESSNRADRLEGDYLKKFPGFQVAMASNEALNDYTQNVLFPAYARSNIKINKSAYLGQDGNYYPGIGLAQWTGPRGYRLLQLAKQQNGDWRELQTQLDYANTEFEERGLKPLVNAAETPEDAALIALDRYEMYNGFARKNPKEAAKRTSNARAIYNSHDYKPMGYGLFDSLAGGGLASTIQNKLYELLGIQSSSGDVVGDIGGAISSAVPYSLGANGYDTSGITGSTPMSGQPYVYNGPGLSEQKSVVNKMGSIYGTLQYSLNGGEQNPDIGKASCASTVGWAYNKALGVSGMSASSTEQAKDSRFTTIWTNEGTPLDPSILQPGDVLYQNWNQTRNNGLMKHTEMYAGYNQDLSHGGSPTPGPTLKSLNDYRKQHTMMVRRYTPWVKEGGGDDTSTKKERARGYGSLSGFNVFDDSKSQTELARNYLKRTVDETRNFALNTTGQYETVNDLPASGYGPDSLPSGSKGVETRLDRIITLLGKIATNGEAALKKKQAPPNVSVNYGTPEKTDAPSAPVVVVNQEQKAQPGSNDAQNQARRQMHRNIASISRFS